MSDEFNLNLELNKTIDKLHRQERGVRTCEEIELLELILEDLKKSQSDMIQLELWLKQAQKANLQVLGTVDRIKILTKNRLKALNKRREQ